jgi:signal transduction histidine kinase
VLTVTDEGPGFPDDVDVVRRGESGADSTGLGLAIAHKTATESGGGLVVGRSPSGGGRVVVELGPTT